MGNFYCNHACLGPTQAEVARAMQNAGRTCFVAPTRNQITLVFDSDADTLDEAEIDRVGETLSADCDCPVIAAVVADDDELYLVLYKQGNRTAEYSSVSNRANAFRFATAFRRSAAGPFVWLALHLPIFVFQSTRHMVFSWLLEIPQWCNATGYRYMREGDIPWKLNPDEVIAIGTAPLSE